MTTCCLALGLAKPVHSPFTRLLAAGYYDGPTEGIVECGTCRRIFAFRMLAWDGEQNVRVFGLAPLEEEYETLCKRLLKAPPAAGITVIPPLPNMERSELDRLLASPVTHVVASEDLLAELLSSRTVSREDLSRDHDWLQWLGL
jgi:hypothetical protein